MSAREGGVGSKAAQALTQACNRESKHEKIELHALLHENDYISITYRHTTLCNRHVAPCNHSHAQLQTKYCVTGPVTVSAGCQREPI